MNNLIPQHKDDKIIANELKKHSFEEIKPIVNELLLWVKDYNWPVARPITEYLSSHINEITEELLMILKGNDDIWKYWCINKLINNNNNQTLNSVIKTQLERIVNKPTTSEIKEEVHIIAKETLLKYKE